MQFPTRKSFIAGKEPGTTCLQNKLGATVVFKWMRELHFLKQGYCWFWWPKAQMAVSWSTIPRLLIFNAGAWKVEASQVTWKASFSHPVQCGNMLSYLVFVLQSIQKEQRSNGGFACYTFKLTVEATAKLSCLTGRAISTICWTN